MGAISAPLCHILHSDIPMAEQRRKRYLIAQTLRTLGTFNEAVCPTETLEMANEFYPDSANCERASYYLYHDDRIMEQIGLSALEKGQHMEC